MWKHYSAAALVLIGLVVALIVTTWIDRPTIQVRNQPTPTYEVRRSLYSTPTPYPTWYIVREDKTTPTPSIRPTRVPTRVRYTPTPTPRATPVPDIVIEKLIDMLEGCGGLSEQDQKKVYWSMVVAQDEAVRQADAQGRSTVDYALADLAVMTYFSITARTLECIKAKGNREQWPIPSP